MCVCVPPLKPPRRCRPQGELRISVLPAYLSYDAPWPVRKIPLRCTAHYVAYHVESKVPLTPLSPPLARGRRQAGPPPPRC